MQLFLLLFSFATTITLKTTVAYLANNNIVYTFIKSNKDGIKWFVKQTEKDLFQQQYRRRRRSPAIWGEPAPDYSNAKLEGAPTYLYTLLFVDLKIVCNI